MTTEPKRKLNRPFGYDFVTTSALGRYRDQNNLGLKEIAAKVGHNVLPTTVCYWIMKKRVPRKVLEILNLGARSVSVSNKSSKGEIYLAYVDSHKETAFKSFCEAMNVNIKTVL